MNETHDICSDVAIARAAYMHAPIAMLVAGADGRILSTNDRLQRLFGYAESELVGARLESLIPQALADQHAHVTRETYGLHKTFGPISVEIHLALVTISGHILTVASIVYLGRQHRRTAATTSASDGDCQRLMAELHDGLGQELTAISLLLHATAKNPPASPRALASEIDYLSKLAEHAVQTMRSLATGLSPVEHEHADLAGALRQLARTLSRAAGLIVRFRSRGAGSYVFTGSAAAHLYRIAQEAAANAMKHSQARQITIELVVTKRRVRLMIMDNGCGVGSQPDAGLGLESMRCRAAAIGGVLTIEPGDTEGTRVSCVYPRFCGDFI